MVYALEEFSDRLYIVSEYVQGQTLREELATGPLSLKALLTTGIEIARALVAAHRHGVIHRDLKPENVIRTADGQVKILDFGLARVQEPGGERGPGGARLTARGAILGTPGYMPPEQLRGAEVDARADIFSFGVLLYELASGTHPFAGETSASTIARVLESEPPDVAQLRRACPAALDQIIRTCLEKEPEHRYASTDELLDALQQLHRDTIETTEPRSSGSRASPDISQGTGTVPASLLWWWRCHQAIVGVGYYLMRLPLWSVRPWIPGVWRSSVWRRRCASICGSHHASIGPSSPRNESRRRPGLDARIGRSSGCCSSSEGYSPLSMSATPRCSSRSPSDHSWGSW